VTEVAAGLLSVVVPVYKSEDIVPETHRRLTKVLAGLAPGLDYEIVFVNDGSPDGLLELLHDLAAADPHVTAISLSRNFGHQVAVTAGLDAARGDAAVIIDDDLQDPPEVIPEMVAKWREGYKVVYGVRSERQGESAFKRWTASVYYRLMQWLSDTPLPVDAGDFRLIDRVVIDALKEMREESRYLRGMGAWIGFRQVGVPYVREARYSGESTYDLRRMLRLAIDGALSFSVRPLTLMAQLGFLVTAIALLAGIYLIVERLFSPVALVPGWTSVIVAVLFMGGVQLVSLGVIGAYLGRIFYETKGRPLYFVAERFGGRDADRSA